jgi:hypothetical protein
MTHYTSLERTMDHRNRYTPPFSTADSECLLLASPFTRVELAFSSNNSLHIELSSREDIGVDIFSAITGFVICGLLLRECAGDCSILIRLGSLLDQSEFWAPSDSLIRQSDLITICLGMIVSP